jgi:FixJ family two-component response regulator
MATKLWHVPVRLATGAIILDQGLQKLGADEDTAKWLHGQAAQAFPRFADMDPREFVQLLSAGEIADELYVSLNTVKTHIKSIYRKLDTNRRWDAVKRARQLQLL